MSGHAYGINPQSDPKFKTAQQLLLRMTLKMSRLGSLIKRYFTTKNTILLLTDIFHIFRNDRDSCPHW